VRTFDIYSFNDFEAGIIIYCTHHTIMHPNEKSLFCQEDRILAFEKFVCFNDFLIIAWETLLKKIKITV
jgi:hypothetical protein